MGILRIKLAAPICGMFGVAAAYLFTAFAISAGSTITLSGTPGFEQSMRHGVISSQTTEGSMNIGISTLLQRLADAVRDRDVNAVRDCLYQESTYYNSLVKGFDNLFLSYTDISFEFRLVETRFHDGLSRVSVNVSEAFRAVEVASGKAIKEKSNDIFELVKADNGNWLVYSWYRDKYMQLPH